MRAAVAAAATAAVAASGAAFAAPATEAAPRIGVVSLERILHDSAPAKAALEKLQKEFARRQADIEKQQAAFKTRAENFRKNGPAMSQTQRLSEQRDLAEEERSLARAERAFREERAQRQNEEIQIFIARANQVIQDIARKENYDLIVQEAVYASPRVDITSKVLKALK